MITIAIPTGRLGKQSIQLLKKVQLIESHFEIQRQLRYENKEQRIIYVFVKPSDVMTYIESGLADIGIIGSDTIEETSANIYELMDLNIGVCKMIVAGLNTNIFNEKETIKVATKYDKIATQYFQSINKEVNIFHLNGSVELAPLIALTDVIVDITETGTTLKENGLNIIDTISQISGRLICNQASYYLKSTQVNTIKNRLGKHI